MEEVQELKHACKFCNKSFPCGRSLGGHMRCHLINNSTEKSRNHDQKLNSSNRISTTHSTTTATKLSCSSSSYFELASAGGYGLRENPKKTWRFSDNNNNNVVSSDQETSIFCCRECGKGFQSWKALFGHMKSHSDKLDKPSASSINKNNNSLLEEEEEEEEDSSLNQSANQTKMVLDSQSDNETNTAPNNFKKKKTKRSHRRTRYNVNNSSSSCFNASAAAAAAAAAADVSENVEQEQEEVAMCLMMLSRDHGGLKLSVAAESSDNFSGSSKSPPCSTKTSGIVITKTCSEILRSRRIVSGERSESFFASGNGKSWSRMSRTEVSSDGFLRKDKKKKKAFVKQEKVVEKESEKLMDTNCKRKKLLHDDDGDGDGDEGCYDPELRSDSLKISDPENNMSNKSSHKRSNFECTTCNKTFHSYQALGGHRASHKKSKGCFASSTIESSENTIETDGDGNTNNNHKPNSKNHHFTTNIDESLIIDGGDDQSKAEINTRVSKKSSKGHECPICLKVFPSGQALGGHKRSHLIGGGGGGVGGASSKAKNTRPPTPTPVMPEKSIPKVRDFLDLNLPAPDEEESNGHVSNASLKPWWAGSSHKHEALVGLISN